MLDYPQAWDRNRRGSVACVFELGYFDFDIAGRTKHRTPQHMHSDRVLWMLGIVPPGVEVPGKTLDSADVGGTLVEG